MGPGAWHRLELVRRACRAVCRVKGTPSRLEGTHTFCHCQPSAKAQAILFLGRTPAHLPAREYLFGPHCEHSDAVHAWHVGPKCSLQLTHCVSVVPPQTAARYCDDRHAVHAVQARRLLPSLDMRCMRLVAGDAFKARLHRNHHTRAHAGCADVAPAAGCASRRRARSTSTTELVRAVSAHGIGRCIARRHDKLAGSAIRASCGEPSPCIKMQQVGTWRCNTQAPLNKSTERGTSNVSIR
jgi:hypothetical protein